MTDEEILELVRRTGAREEGFRYLVIKYQQRLYQVIRRQLPTHEDAGDVMQNTFLKIFRHISTFEGRSELFTWMYRIATNEVINHQKRSSRVKTQELDKNDIQQAEAFMDSEKVTQSLEAAVSILPERQQLVFRMRYYDELSYREMAEVLKVTEGALKASYHHAVRKIEEEFRAKQIL